MVVLSQSFQRGGRAGGDKRGNAAQRRARKGYLLTLWGDGISCPCSYCGHSLVSATLEADRIIAGGSYARTNVIPSCGPCNKTRSDQTLWSFAPNVARRLKRLGFTVSVPRIPAGQAV